MFLKNLLTTTLFFSGFLAVAESSAGENSPPPIERMEPKQPDPVNQGECRQRGQINCEGDEECEEICNDIFRGRVNKRNCYKYSLDMVFAFEDLLEAAEDGDVKEIEDIGSPVLGCLLDIDERGFAKAIKEEWKRWEAKYFALLIASDESFAEVLRDGDDAFNILKQLLNKLSGSNELEEALSQKVEDNKTLLWLFAEESEPAWEYLDSYVSKMCYKRDDCPGDEKIGAYCNALLKSGFSENEWKDFLWDAHLFAEDYEEEVEDDNYEYEIIDSPSGSGDFRDYCRHLVLY